MQAFESFLRLAVVARVGHRMTLGVGREARESHIDADLLACRDVCDHAVRLDGELHVVAIGSMDNPHPFDLLGRECCNLLLTAVVTKVEPSRVERRG